jgi:hypothetical protein
MDIPKPSHYAPHHTMPEFTEGMNAYMEDNHKNPYKGPQAIAWDRGHQYAIAVVRASRIKNPRPY